MVRIVPIVEGLGEVQAVPVLIRRIAADAAPDVFVHVVKPLRVPRQRILKRDNWKRPCGSLRSRAVRTDAS